VRLHDVLQFTSRGKHCATYFASSVTHALDLSTHVRAKVTTGVSENETATETEIIKLILIIPLRNRNITRHSAPHEHLNLLTYLLTYYEVMTS